MAINTTPFVSGAVLTAAQMTNLPMGAASITSGTAGTAIVANTTLAVLTSSTTIYSGRNYQIFGKLAFQANANASVGAAMWITANSVNRTLYYQTAGLGSVFLNLGISGFAVYTATELGVTSGSAAVSIVLNFKCGSAGSLASNPDSFISASSFQQQLIVMDIGAT